MMLSSALFLSASLAVMPVGSVGLIEQAPQGASAPGRAHRGVSPPGGQPGGAIPEPATILLLVGGALGYGAYRFKQARNQAGKER